MVMPLRLEDQQRGLIARKIWDYMWTNDKLLRASIKRIAAWLLLVLSLVWCGLFVACSSRTTTNKETNKEKITAPDRTTATVTEDAPPAAATPKTPLNYKIVHRFTADDKTEFLSVIVRKGISDPDLIAIATELHQLHPTSDIEFYDKSDVNRIQQWWKCFEDATHKINNPRCPDGPDEWINEHNVGSVASSFDNNDPKHNGPAKWFLTGPLSFRRIAYLGIDGRAAEKPVPQVRGPQIGDSVRVQAGQMKVIETALAPGNYADFTRCLDGADSIRCVAKLLDAHKILQVSSGTKAKLLMFADNPYKASLLKGRLVQISILEGPLRNQTVWTLEDRVVK